MTLIRNIEQILNDCPICSRHSENYADMHCNSDHARLRKALRNDRDYSESQRLRDELAAAEHQISTLKERLARIAQGVIVIHSEIAHIDDAVSLNG